MRGATSIRDIPLPDELAISIHAPRAGSDGTQGAAHIGDAGYFNPRSPCGERPGAPITLFAAGGISIHAPRAGSDRHGLAYQVNAPISIHAPRAGSDVIEQIFIPRRTKFQSTLPVRGATEGSCHSSFATFYFNPRSPCGERHGKPEAGDNVDRHFNPRSPCGERPELLRLPQGTQINFNPRSPCGERQ